MAKFKVGDKCKILDITEGFYHKDKIGQIVEIKNVLDLPDMPQYGTSAGFGNICENRLKLVDKYQIIHEKTVAVFVDCEGNEHATRELAENSNKKIELQDSLKQKGCYGPFCNLEDNLRVHREAILKYLSE